MNAPGVKREPGNTKIGTRAMRELRAKTDTQGQPGISVRDHCLNVGCVAEALLQAQPIQGVHSSEKGALLVFNVGLALTWRGRHVRLVRLVGRAQERQGNCSEKMGSDCSHGVA